MEDGGSVESIIRECERADNPNLFETIRDKIQTKKEKLAEKDIIHQNAFDKSKASSSSIERQYGAHGPIPRGNMMPPYPGMPYSQHYYPYYGVQPGAPPRQAYPGYMPPYGQPPINGKKPEEQGQQSPIKPNQK